MPYYILTFNATFNNLNEQGKVKIYTPTTDYLPNIIKEVIAKQMRIRHSGVKRVAVNFLEKKLVTKEEYDAATDVLEIKKQE